MKLKSFFRELFRDTLQTVWVMFRIMIPVSIGVKILQETGAIEYIGIALAPLMRLVGLPGEMGLVWGTGIITNLFGGIMAYINIAPDFHLTVAQTTVLCLMMLVAHTFPIELQIARKAGVRLITMFIFRFVFAFLMGLILYWIYSGLNIFNEPSVITWKPNVVSDNSIQTWVLGELKNYAVIFLIIFALLLVMKILKVLGIIDLIARGLSPFLKFLGIGSEVTSIAIIGLTLGVVYGGALIINESRTKKIDKRDIFYCLLLMGLCHSLVEDTILMLALGSDISGVLVFRIIISLLIIWAVVKITRRFPDSVFKKYFVAKK
jgi:hypothetical protein